MVTTRTLPKGTTLFEKYSRRKPDVKNLQTFGCLAYVWNPDATGPKKLDDHATKVAVRRGIIRSVLTLGG
jgi:hypothetical protein